MCQCSYSKHVRRVPEWQLSWMFAAMLHRANWCLFCWQVHHVGYQLGKLQAEASSLSVLINGEAVARLYSLRVQLEPLRASKAIPAFTDAPPGAETRIKSRRHSSMLDNIILPEHSDRAKGGPNNASPHSCPDVSPGVHSAAAAAAGVPPMEMPFEGEPSELQRARQRAGLSVDSLPAHVTVTCLPPLCLLH